MFDRVRPAATAVTSTNDHRFELPLSLPDAPDTRNPYPQLMRDSEWRHRLDELHGTFRRWRWSLWERVSVCVLVCLSIVVPIFSGSIVDRYIVSSDGPLPLDATEAQITQRLADSRRAHLITIAIVIVFLALVWIPYSIWRVLATRQIHLRLAAFNALDAEKGHPSSGLQWSLLRSSTFTRTATVLITLPASHVILPPFVGANAVSEQGGLLPAYVAKDPNPSPAYPFPVGGHPADRATARPNPTVV